MLAVPDESVHRTKIADWLELKAIASPDNRVAFSTLLSGTALIENEQEENIADEDLSEEELVLNVQAEIGRRTKMSAMITRFALMTRDVPCSSFRQ